MIAGNQPVLVHNCGGDVSWVPENTSRSSAASDYEAGTYGARSRVSTRQREVPALDYVTLDGEIAEVRFDGFNPDMGEMIDRKLGVATTEKTGKAAMRQSLALEQNGYVGVWEVPNQRAFNRASRLLNRVNIANITVRLVP